MDGFAGRGPTRTEILFAQSDCAVGSGFAQPAGSVAASRDPYRGARPLDFDELTEKVIVGMGLALSLPARFLRWGMNIWPPLLGAGVCVRRIAPDFREVEIEMPLRWYNRNAYGTQFGGSLYAMTDPFFALMLVHNLGPDYVVWDRAASIDYLAAGRSRVRAVLRIQDHDLEAIRRMTESGSKHLHVFHAEVVDAEQLLVARIEKVVYVRRRKSPAGLDAEPGAAWTAAVLRQPLRPPEPR